jgi:hypothetical protein
MMDKRRIAIIAVTATLLAGSASAAPQGAPAPKEQPAASGMRPDDPCAEPKKELKKRSTPRQGDDKGKTDPKKP